MAEKSLSDELSHLMSDTPALKPEKAEAESDQPKDALAESLMAVAGEKNEALETALEEFLSGKGALHETTRLALTRGESGLSEVIALLVKQFKLSPAVAKLIASLILKLQPSTGGGTPAKKKPRRKSKPKTAASAKKEAAKKPKKKPIAKAKKKPASTAKKPKKTAPKTAAKKKPASKTARKKTAARKTKKKTRTSTVTETP